MITSRIAHKIKTSKQLDFGSIFSDSIELFKKTWSQGLIVTLLTVGLILPIYFVMYLPFIVLGIDPELIDDSQQINIGVAFFAGILFLGFTILAAAVSLGLQAVFFRICKQKDFGEERQDDYFYYFKTTYIPKLIALAAVILVISIISTLLCVLPLFYVIVPMSFMTVVFAFNSEKSVSEIMALSFKLGNKKWLISFGLIMLCGILAEVVGILLCFVGLFATASFAYIPLYLIYKAVIGFETEQEERLIEKSTL